MLKIFRRTSHFSLTVYCTCCIDAVFCEARFISCLRHADRRNQTLLCFLLSCLVFFTPVYHFHFFCKCSFDTWLPDLCIFIFLFPFSGSLLYWHGNQLFVALSVTCFLLAFFKWQGGGGCKHEQAVSRLHYVILLLLIDISWHQTLFVPVHALNWLSEAYRMSIGVHNTFIKDTVNLDYWCWVSDHVWRE